MKEPDNTFNNLIRARYWLGFPVKYLLKELSRQLRRALLRRSAKISVFPRCLLNTLLYDVLNVFLNCLLKWSSMSNRSQSNRLYLIFIIVACSKMKFWSSKWRPTHGINKTTSKINICRQTRSSTMPENKLTQIITNPDNNQKNKNDEWIQMKSYYIIPHVMSYDV